MSRARKFQLLAVALATLSGGCRQEADVLPHIILISFDTFRADAISPDLTPSLSLLAEDSVTFEKAYVPYPHTLSSHMTLLTGVYPGVHGVYPEGHRLPDGLTTLAAVLKEAGYRTSGIVTSEWLKEEFGFARSFDRYERLPHQLTYADRVNAAAVEELAGAAARPEPHFLFLHYYDAHSDFQQANANKLPYYSPPEYRQDLLQDEKSFCDEEGACATSYLMSVDKKRISLAPDQIAAISELYRRGVRALDDEMGRFFLELRRRDLYDDSLIIVTSDHGEEFREHGRFIHSQPYEETVSVPLLIKFPGAWKAGSKVIFPVESVDILPTIANLVRLEAPAHLQGRSLIPLLENSVGEARDVLSQDSIAFFRYSLRAEGFNFIVNLKHGQPELYDLGEDPKELRNVFSERPDVARDLRHRLVSRIRANRVLSREFDAGDLPTDELLTQDERENLKALGYLQ